MKILCIDFNIIMAPCIRLYMDKCMEGENVNVVWEFLERSYGINDFLLYDAGILKDIAKVLGDNKKSKIYLCDEQKECVTDILRVFKNIGQNEKNNCMRSQDRAQITCVDYFHDLYTQNVLQKEGVILRRTEEISDYFEEYSEKNWLGYLKKRCKNLEIRWVKHASSRMPAGDSIDRILSVKDLSLLENNFDRIYFSRSAMYVPYKYQHLYDVLACIGDDVEMLKAGDESRGKMT